MSYDPESIRKHPLINDPRERTRRNFKPEKVKFLLVGESVPENGSFFYYGDSILFDHTVRAFSETFHAIMKVNFLSKFKKLGFYLDDLCSEPVNQLKVGDDKRIRLRLRELYEIDLTARVAQHSPEFLIVKPIGDPGQC